MSDAEGRRDADAARRLEELLEMLGELRRAAESRYRDALARQLSGEAAGDSEGVHGWKASREGGPDVEILAMLDRSIQQIDAALARARAGAYGACASCHDPIPLARLRAIPFATRCAPCQTDSESRSRR
jgi:RNA polymerase-binding transcription factor DksA